MGIPLSNQPSAPVSASNNVEPISIKPSKIKQPWSKKKKIIVFGSVGIVVIILGIVIWKVSSHKPIVEPEKKPEANLSSINATTTSLLTGEQLVAESANRQPVAAMIENSPDARPQTGLTSADIVYETVAEGGITRFMGIFSSSLPEKAGPIRSARSYYLDWLGEYDGFYVHAGGSPSALAKISEYGVKDSPHNSTKSFWRESRPGIASEHTLFANLKSVFDAGVAKGWPSTNSKITSWKFTEPITQEATNPVINITFSSPSYNVRWIYDPATKKYSRELAGTPHRDGASKEQITTTNIVVEQSAYSSNGVYPGTLKTAEGNLKTIGSDKVYIFRGGQKIEGTWNKASRTDRTKFLDTSGNEITLYPGKTWIEVIPQNGSVS